MEISSRHSSEARVHWHPAPSCPAQTRRLLHCGNLHMREATPGHTSTRGPLVYLHYLAESAHSNYHVNGNAVTQCPVSRGVTPCHASHVTAHLISLIGQQLCTQRCHTTCHTAPHFHQLATQSHFTWESPEMVKLPTTAVKLRGPIVKLNIRWLRPPGQARISLPQSPRRPGTD